MSHFTTVETKIQCLVTLKKVIEEMGFAFKEEGAKVRGYQGELADAIAVIDTKSSYDLGIVKTQTGYSFIGDWDMLQVRAGIEKDDFLKTVNKKYAYHKVIEEVKKRGYSVVEEQTNEQQHVTVKVRRFA
jgi:hypothetical protein